MELRDSLALAPVSVAVRLSEKGISGKLVVAALGKSERTWIRISCSIRTFRVLSEIWF